MKVIRLAGLLTMAMALVLLIVNLFGFFDNESILAAFNRNATLPKIGAWIIIILCAIQFVIGIIGAIGKGKKLCLICGVILIILSIPTDFDNTPMMVIKIISLLFAVMFIVGAFLIGKFEGSGKPATVPAETVDASFNDPEEAVESVEAEIVEDDHTK